jgi:hypothetical protein
MHGYGGFTDPQLGGRLAGLACSKDSFSFGAISHLRTMGLLKGCRLLAAFFKIAKQRYSLHAEYQTRFILMGYEVNDIRQRLDFIARISILPIPVNYVRVLDVLWVVHVSLISHDPT